MEKIKHPTRVSVCIATFNGSPYIIDQLLSILSQIGESDEIIICDDFSSDDTVQKITSLADHRIILYQNHHNIGYTKTFERALRLASGEYIFLSDQDDVWFPLKLETCLEKLTKYSLVVTDCSHTDVHLRILHYSHFALHKVRKGFLPNFFASRYVGACMAFRRNVLLMSLPFPKVSQFCPHDYWIALIASAYFSVGLVSRPCMYYRRHSTNASSGGSRSQRSLIIVLCQRFYVLNHILYRFYRYINL
ncbi:UDP-Glc:alpha-D-GlcNAc-diphosphoundecaprenol beta-1,3-glucosyltransferase WfgD [Synechococcus sp. CBW1107]|nr:UDP-Glc:alpha-D-GlcNAc-diphosphoundecaprenol beta-1,3-glucosyltransferase WfgD [Synechococcus sp. CBW1107]